MSFLKIWRKDSLVHIFSEMDSKNLCSQDSVVNVSRVESMRYCKQLHLNRVDRGEDGCPDWENIADEQFPATIKVITQVNQLKRRAHMWLLIPLRTLRRYPLLKENNRCIARTTIPTTN